MRTKPNNCESDITFVSVHLDWLGDDSSRFTQATVLVEALGPEAGPVVIAGDFNDTPDSRTMRLVFSAFENAEKPTGDRFTFSSTDPSKEIDFIVYRPSSAFTGSSRVLDEPVASDHRPVVSDLLLRSPKTTPAPQSDAPPSPV